jgi:hypothetical protein
MSDKPHCRHGIRGIKRTHGFSKELGTLMKSKELSREKLWRLTFVTWVLISMGLVG